MNEMLLDKCCTLDATLQVVFVGARVLCALGCALGCKGEGSGAGRCCILWRYNIAHRPVHGSLCAAFLLSLPLCQPMPHPWPRALHCTHAAQPLCCPTLRHTHPLPPTPQQPTYTEVTVPASPTLRHTHPPPAPPQQAINTKITVICDDRRVHESLRSSMEAADLGRLRWGTMQLWASCWAGSFGGSCGPVVRGQLVGPAAAPAEAPREGSAVMRTQGEGGA